MAVPIDVPLWFAIVKYVHQMAHPISKNKFDWMISISIVLGNSVAFEMRRIQTTKMLTEKFDNLNVRAYKS